MRPFKIQKIPVLAAKKCFENLEPSQLFEMSRFSKKMLQKIKEASVRCEKHSVSFTKDNPSICMVFPGDKTFEITFNREWKDRRSSLKFTKIKDMPFSFAYNSKNSIVVLTDRKSLFTLLYHLYDHLASLFPTPCLDELIVDVNTIKNFMRLLYIPEFSKCNSIQLIGSKMDITDARFVLDTCTILDMFVLTAELAEPLNRPNVFKFDKLIIERAGWVTFEDLLEMECEHVYLKDTTLTDKEVNQLIKLWQSAEQFPRLKSLEIDFIGQTIPHPVYLPSMITPALHNHQHIKYAQIMSLMTHFEVQIPAAHLNWRNGRPVSDNRIQYDQFFIISGLNFTHALSANHPMGYERNAKSFSSILNQPATLPIKRFDFDIKRADGTFATLRISANRLQMLVWPTAEVIVDKN